MKTLEPFYDLLQKVIVKKQQEGCQCAILSPWYNRQDSIMKKAFLLPLHMLWHRGSKMPYWAASIWEGTTYENLVQLRGTVQKLFKGVISKNFRQTKWRKTESKEKFYLICYIQDQWLKAGKKSACHPNALNWSTRIQGDPGFKLSAHVQDDCTWLQFLVPALSRKKALLETSNN